MKDEKDILYKDLVIPKIVWDKAEEAFTQISRDNKCKIIAASKKKNKFYIPKAASVVLICLLLLGTTVSAAGLIMNYRERLKSMTEQEVEEAYNIVNQWETNRHNRKLTEAEQKRYVELEKEYKENGLFPSREIKILSAGENYDGEGLALENSTRTFYLPERELSNEELLQMIDMNHKMSYAIDEKIEERILQANPWMERMAELSSEELDRIYLVMYGARTDVCGRYSRSLSTAEQVAYNKLLKQYEQDNICSENEIMIIESQDLYDGESVALCTADAVYYLPDRELTELELLKIIDFSHKADYAIKQINKEVNEGIRSGYPEK